MVKAIPAFTIKWKQYKHLLAARQSSCLSELGQVPSVVLVASVAPCVEVHLEQMGELVTAGCSWLSGCAGSRTLPAGAIPERWAVCFPNSPYPIHPGAGFLAHPHIWKTAYFPSEKYFSFHSANSGWIVGQERNISSAASGGAIAEPSHATLMFPELTNYPCSADRKLTHICITGVSAFVSHWNV